MIGCKNLNDLKAAQFIMGPELYCAWVWRERAKIAAPVPQSKMRIKFLWQNNKNVVDIKSKRK